MELNAYGNEAARTALFPISTGWDYLLSSIPEEVGEFSAIFAKAARAGRERQLTTDELFRAKAELGDILWNVALAARQLGTNLETIAQGNLNKLADRATRGQLEGYGDNR
jgi:NTP pyrophosphatase (non-canonical NTP hydrolase)